MIAWGVGFVVVIVISKLTRLTVTGILAVLWLTLIPWCVGKFLCLLFGLN